MTSTPKIKSSTIRSESKVVGESTDYFFKIRPSVPLISGDIMEVIVPKQISTIIGRTLEDCYGITKL